MVLARAWMRQVLGASGAALIVPVAMLGAVVALVFAGGLGRIGSLGQALSGPQLPASAPATSSGGPAAPGPVAPRPPRPQGGSRATGPAAGTPAAAGFSTLGIAAVPGALRGPGAGGARRRATPHHRLINNGGFNRHRSVGGRPGAGRSSGRGGS